MAGRRLRHDTDEETTMTQRDSRIRGRMIVAGALAAALVLSACNSGGSGGADEAKAGETTTLPPREPGVTFPVKSAEAAAEDLAAIALRNFSPGDPSFGVLGKDGSWAEAGIAGDNLEAAASPATPEVVSVFPTKVDFKSDPPVEALAFAVKDDQDGCAYGVVYVDYDAPNEPQKRVVIAEPGATCSARAGAELFESGGLAG
jgi:hypothetical protein